MFCGKCGNAIQEDVTFCPTCGTKINNFLNNDTRKHAEQLLIEKVNKTKTLSIIGAITCIVSQFLFRIFYSIMAGYAEEELSEIDQQELLTPLFIIKILLLIINIFSFIVLTKNTKQLSMLYESLRIQYNTDLLTKFFDDYKIRSIKVIGIINLLFIPFSLIQIFASKQLIDLKKFYQSEKDYLI